MAGGATGREPLSNMSDSEIVATYSNTALAGVIRDLSSGKAWWPDGKRLEAAKLEAAKRRIQEHQQDTESEQ